MLLYFEYIHEILPCELCIWQRLPHSIVVLLGIFTLFNSNYRLIICSACLLTIVLGLFLSGYHVGIEYKFWSGPENCSGTNNLQDLSPDLFLETILKAPIISCDEITWSFLNISMAGWNLLVSLILTIGWSWATLDTFQTSRS